MTTNANEEMTIEGAAPAPSGYRSLALKTLTPIAAGSPGSLALRVGSACDVVGLELDEDVLVTSVRVGKREVALLEGEDWSAALRRDGHVPSNTYVMILVRNLKLAPAVLAGQLVVVGAADQAPTSPVEVLSAEGERIDMAPPGAQGQALGTQDTPRVIKAEASIGLGGSRGRAPQQPQRAQPQQSPSGDRMGTRAGPRVVRAELGSGQAGAPGRPRTADAGQVGEMGTREAPRLIHTLVGKSRAAAHRTVKASEVKSKYVGTVKNRHAGAQTMTQGPKLLEPAGGLHVSGAPSKAERPAIRHTNTGDVILAAPNHDGDRMVALDRGAARQLLRLVVQKIPLENGFAPSIARALSAGMAVEGARSWGENEIAVSLTSEQASNLRKQIDFGPFRALVDREAIIAALNEGFARAQRPNLTATDKLAAVS
jgi:hypothetical protein